MFTLVFLFSCCLMQRTRRADLGDELFFGVGGRAEETQVGERLTVEPRRMTRGVHKFMVQGGVIRFRIVKAGWARHMQRIGRGRIEGAWMPVEDRRALRHR